jgi:hypothetical protein
MVQLIATQLQLNQNNSFSTIMQLHYNCTHDVMLISLIIIYLLKYDMWHYEFLKHKNDFFSKYWSSSFIMIVNDGLKLWHMAQ